MIVVKIELHSAITSKITLLGKMVICNDGESEDPKRGHYKAYVLRKRDAGSDIRVRYLADATRYGRVRDYPRLSYAVWRLVLRALRACYPEEK